MSSGFLNIGRLKYWFSGKSIDEMIKLGRHPFALAWTTNLTVGTQNQFPTSTITLRRDRSPTSGSQISVFTGNLLWQQWAASDSGYSKNGEKRYF
jgi:hypothetical protein